MLDELADHIAQYCTDRIESLVCGADVVQSIIVQQYFLHNEYGDRLAKLRAGLHDSKTEGDDLCGQKKVDDLRRVVLDKGADHAEARESKVFEGAALRRRVEERIEIEWNMG